MFNLRQICANFKTWLNYMQFIVMGVLLYNHLPHTTRWSTSWKMTVTLLKNSLFTLIIYLSYLDIMNNGFHTTRDKNHHEMHGTRYKSESGKKKWGRFTENTKQNNRQLLTSVIINEDYIAFLKLCFNSHIIIRKMKYTA